MQSDFGVKDGALAAMKGVAIGVSSSLKIFDLTHDIPPYNIWEAANRLYQTAAYWPAGTVFVSVVDPGVGSQRRSVVMKSKTGHFFVTPDNGTLTLVAQYLGVQNVREIDEVKNRLASSGGSYTFHGRDVYAYTAARLAAGKITYAQVGKLLDNTVVAIPYQAPVFTIDSTSGTIPVLDIQYGNLWTNIDTTVFNRMQLKTGDEVDVAIYHGSKKIYESTLPYVTTFSAVEKGKPLLYLNSLMNVAIALNEDNFSEKYKVYSGSAWKVVLKTKR